MTRKDAVLRALAFEPVDPPPYHLDFTRAMRERLARHLGASDVDAAVGNYLLCVNVGSNAGAEVNRVAAGLMKPLGGARFEDEFGVIWDRSGGDDIGVPANQVLVAPDPGLCRFPDPADPRRWAGYEAVAAAAGDRFVLACFSSPLFQRAWFLRGLAPLLEDLLLNPGFVHGLLDGLLAFSLGIVREVARRGADGIFLYDDYAQQAGPLFSPGLFREFFAPRLAALVRAARRAGLAVFYHSCGDVSLLLEDMANTGIQVFNPLQPEAMDVAGAARQFRGRLAFYGGLSTQKTLPYGRPEDVRRDVAALRALFREQGGFILGPAHAIQPDVPLENVMALLDAVRA